MKILITGLASFIGSSIPIELRKNEKNKIIGINNLDS